MFVILSKYKGASQWLQTTNMGQQFAGEKGLMEYFIEKALEKHPNIEFKLVQVQ